LFQHSRFGVRWGILISLVLCAAPATARDLFVNNVTGDDRLDGSALTRRERFVGPLKTINRALRLANKGDRIVLANNDEPYRESISFNSGRHTGDGLQPFTLVGNGAVLDGSVPIPSRAWEHYQGDVFRYRMRWVGHHQVFLNDRPAVRRPGAIPRKKPPTLQPLEWDMVGEWVYVCVEPSRVPEDYALSHTTLQTGITLYQVHDFVIEDLYVQGFRIDGVHANDNVHNCRLERLTCRGNGRSGIFVGGYSRGVVVQSCLVGNNGEAQLLSRPSAEVIVRDSKILDQ
jgi:hypothetical protein